MFLVRGGQENRLHFYTFISNGENFAIFRGKCAVKNMPAGKICVDLASLGPAAVLPSFFLSHFQVGLKCRAASLFLLLSKLEEHAIEHRGLAALLLLARSLLLSLPD